MQQFFNGYFFVPAKILRTAIVVPISMELWADPIVALSKSKIQHNTIHTTRNHPNCGAILLHWLLLLFPNIPLYTAIKHIFNVSNRHIGTAELYLSSQHELLPKFTLVLQLRKMRNFTLPFAQMCRDSLPPIVSLQHLPLVTQHCLFFSFISPLSCIASVSKKRHSMCIALGGTAGLLSDSTRKMWVFKRH